MVFLCCLHNEYIVLYYFGLEYDTEDEISNRGLSIEMNPLNFKLDDFEDDEQTDINEPNEKNKNNNADN